MKLAVLGTGYVGLVSGVCLAAAGHDVTCIDLRREIVESLNAGKPHIHEPGLPGLLADVLAAGRFHCTIDMKEALEGTSLVLVAVGTPSVDGEIDLRFIRDAAVQLGEYLRAHKRYLSVIIKSTVVPGTTDTVVRNLLEEHSGRSLGGFGLGMNPEFLREGNAVADFMNPDRIVFGYEDEKTLSLLHDLYSPWNCDKVPVNTRTAEMIKYANNCLLATQISAVNELANLCFELGGIDFNDVANGVHLDKRWSPLHQTGRIKPEILTYLVAGCGFGGSCFPKDVQALRTLGKSHGLPMNLLQAVLDINDRQPLQIVRQLESALGDLKGRHILVLGLAFKPDTDDLRESASLNIIRRLVELGAAVTTHDPIAMDNARRDLAGLPVNFTSNWQDAISLADAVVVATRWRDYSELAAQKSAAYLKGKILVDARRMFQPSDFPETQYLTIGRRAA